MRLPLAGRGWRRASGARLRAVSGAILGAMGALAGTNRSNAPTGAPKWAFGRRALEANMTRYSIALIVGSLRRDSWNRRFGEALVRLAPADFSFVPVPIGDLPLYNQDDDATPAPAVTRLRAAITASQGLLFVTPEYNRSIPGVLKNALDHGSRPYGKSVWAGKPAGIVGVSPGAAGTAMAQQHLRNILSAVDVPTLCLPEVYVQAKDGLFDESGNIGAGSQKFLQAWMDRYVTWIKQHCA